MQSGLWVTAVLTESRGILCLHLFLRPHVSWMSLGIRGKWHICCWKCWDRPWLVLQLHSHLLQDGDPLLLVMVCPCFSLVPASKLLKEHSISNSSGDIDQEELADVVVSGLEAFDEGWELLSDDVSDEDEELSVPLVLVLIVLELSGGELGKDTEDSLVVVSDTGCELAGWESLNDGCGSLRSECLSFTHVCFKGKSRSGSLTSSLNFLLFLVEVSCPGCLLDGTRTVLLTGLSWNLVFFGLSARLDPPAWHCLWN